MNEQIEEMAKSLCKVAHYDFCKDTACHICPVKPFAVKMYDEDYRKSSDVARDIFGNLKILGYIDFDGNFCIRKDSFEALEKQYESEGAE